MRLVCISDTHSKHRDIQLPEGDILVHAGDISWRGEHNIIQDFNKWLGTLSFKHKIVIAGNHDLSFEKPLPGSNINAREFITNAIYLENQEVVIDGIKFWGSPVSPWFHDWAFNVYRGKDIKKVWDRIPLDTHVLITHGPPNAILDKTKRGDEVGCYDLSLKIRELKQLQAHIFGHIHEAYGKDKFGDVTYVNASICDLHYSAVNSPIVIDIKVPDSAQTTESKQA